MFNPKKYVFGVSSGKLFGYMVLFRGIDANPKRWKPSNNCNHLGPKKESRNWQT
jgi:hypothetical protein